jgi:hypothetical protein
LLIGNTTYTYLFRVTAVTATQAIITYITSLRGATGSAGPDGKSLRYYNQPVSSTNASFSSSGFIPTLTGQLQAGDTVLTKNGNLYAVTAAGYNGQLVQTLAGRSIRFYNAETSESQTSVAFSTALFVPTILYTDIHVGDITVSKNGLLYVHTQEAVTSGTKYASLVGPAGPQGPEGPKGVIYKDIDLTDTFIPISDILTLLGIDSPTKILQIVVVNGASEKFISVEGGTPIILFVAPALGGSEVYFGLAHTGANVAPVRQQLTGLADSTSYGVCTVRVFYVV